MLQALTRLFRRRVDEAQLDLLFQPIVAPTNADELLLRLRGLGLKNISSITLTKNRNVMVSFRDGVLRANAGYLAAPENVLRAIVAFVEGRTRADRRAGRDLIVAFPIVADRAPARRERMHDDDRPMAAQLSEWHARYNTRHFGGTLRDVDMRVSRRMKSRLGHYSAATDGVAAEIAISRSHIKRHGWTEALHTLLHEMVHQWQDETGGPIDHGRTFRKKCREVGIAPYARRALAGRVNAPTRRAAREG